MIRTKTRVSLLLTIIMLVQVHVAVIWYVCNSSNEPFQILYKVIQLSFSPAMLSPEEFKHQTKVSRTHICIFLLQNLQIEHIAMVKYTVPQSQVGWVGGSTSSMWASSFTTYNWEVVQSLSFKPICQLPRTTCLDTTRLPSTRRSRRGWATVPGSIGACAAVHLSVPGDAVTLSDTVSVTSCVSLKTSLIMHISPSWTGQSKMPFYSHFVCEMSEILTQDLNASL